MIPEYTPAPDRDDRKDIGWFWIRLNPDLHYYRSNEKATLAISHCGRIDLKKKLVEIETLPKCSYCQFIEGQRATRSEKEGK